MFDFTLVVLPGTFASGVGVSLDTLACATAIAHEAGCAPPRWRICSTEKSVLLSSGLQIEAAILPEKPKSDGSVWLLPGLGLNDAEAVINRLAQPDAVTIANGLKAHSDAGGIIAASCSAVFLLHAAGLLSSKRVTTTWWLGGLLQQMAPDCQVDVDQIVVADGNIITGGAAFAHIDLMLHLLRIRFGPALAESVSRAMVIDGRQSQAPFIVPAILASSSDVATRLVACFEARLPNPPSVEELAAELSMSSRTLSRRIKATTGKSVSALLQSVRINRARILLESTNISVEKIAEQVGYADTTALRRLMRKVTQATPRQFRGKRNA
ncbi:MULTISPECIES: GlxA family transcriptional regulator [Aminobacter]|nr:helix-turn-helix domain-containing protein [Aminobacter ciceronei]